MAISDTVIVFLPGSSGIPVVTVVMICDMHFPLALGSIMSHSVSIGVCIPTVLFVIVIGTYTNCNMYGQK